MSLARRSSRKSRKGVAPNVLISVTVTNSVAPTTVRKVSSGNASATSSFVKDLTCATDSDVRLENCLTRKR
eukprot:scaffold952_cov409-Prasinococcus_capsulatus_cf.AAC.14